jgi:hypothetical protein
MMRKTTEVIKFKDFMDGSYKKMDTPPTEKEMEYFETVKGLASFTLMAIIAAPVIHTTLLAVGGMPLKAVTAYGTL